MVSRYLRPSNALVAAGAALLCIASANSQTGSMTTPAASGAVREVETSEMLSLRAGEYRPAWATRLIGRPVIDHRGGNRGRLEDLLVDLDTGAVAKALVSDLRAREARLVAVPVRLLRMTEQGAVFLDLDPEHYARQPSWRSQDVSGAYRVTRLIGMPVSDHQGRPLGRIGDIVVAMDRQKVDHAVLRYWDPGTGVLTDHAFAVPIESLTPAAGAAQVRLNMPQARLAGLIGSDADHGRTDVTRYLGRIDFGPVVQPPVGATR